MLHPLSSCAASILIEEPGPHLHPAHGASILSARPRSMGHMSRELGQPRTCRICNTILRKSHDVDGAERATNGLRLPLSIKGKDCSNNARRVTGRHCSFDWLLHPFRGKSWRPSLGLPNSMRIASSSTAIIIPVQGRGKGGNEKIHEREHAGLPSHIGQLCLATACHASKHAVALPNTFKPPYQGLDWVS